MRNDLPTDFKDRILYAETVAQSPQVIRLTPYNIAMDGRTATEQQIDKSRVAVAMLAMEYADLFDIKLSVVLENLRLFPDNHMGWSKRFTEAVLTTSKWLDEPMVYEPSGDRNKDDFSITARGRKGTKIMRSRAVCIKDINPESGAGREAWKENPVALLEARALNDFVGRYAGHIFLGLAEVSPCGPLVSEERTGAKLPEAHVSSGEADSSAIVRLAKASSKFGQVDTTVRTAAPAVSAPLEAPAADAAGLTKRARKRSKSELREMELQKQESGKGGEATPNAQTAELLGTGPVEGQIMVELAPSPTALPGNGLDMSRKNLKPALPGGDEADIDRLFPSGGTSAVEF